MDTKYQISLSTLIIICSVAGITFTDNLFKVDEYICEDRLELGSYPCNTFTKYYGLENGKCINTDTGNKLCRTGWEKVVNETKITPEGELVINYRGREWLCEADELTALCYRDNHQAYRHQLIE